LKHKDSIIKYLPLFFPWGLSLLFINNPTASYFIAWLGSFYIFYVTLTGKIKPLPTDRGLAEQLMRPIFIVQIIFAGYMCCTSIFYFLNLQGHVDFKKASDYFFVDQANLMATASCQRYYCLAHASFVMGILLFMDYDFKQKYYTENDKLANLVLVIALIAFPVSILFLKVSGLAQFYFQLSSLSFVAGTLALAFAIPLKNVRNIIVSGVLYSFNFYEALTSGFKEPIIISVLVLGIFLYPSYKKMVTAIFVPLMILLFMVLPTYNAIFRANAWGGSTDVDEAYELALDATLNGSVNSDDSNWAFLSNRLSEIDMFTTFVESTPKTIPYYGLTLVKQSAIAIVPRVFWPSKPITEDLIMQRVYDAGVVSRNSSVSAKPAYVVDAYLSYGNVGIIVFLFAYGAIAQIISIKAEKLFGGYILGTALIFSGLFQIFWRGLSFEFITNTVFWSYISMLVIFKILRARNILKEI
jgi:hypothetical protein